MGKLNKSQVLRAIKGTGGIVSQIAKKLDVEWHTADTYIEKWEETRQAYDDEENRVLDLAESQLLKAIKKGEVAEAKWFLSRKGRKRGYVTGQEISGPGGKPIQQANINFNVNLDLSDLSDDELQVAEKLFVSGNGNGNGNGNGAQDV